MGKAMTDAGMAAIPPVERMIARDLLRRGLIAAPVLVAACAAFAGRTGALTAAYALAIVLTNLVASAALLAWAAPQGPTVLMGTALGGFLGRMVIVGLAVWAVSDVSWINVKLLAVAVLVTHLGLLAWETKYVSASLAYPALKPRGDR
jgi:hypothetical protein